MGERQQPANNLELRKSLLIKTGLFNVHRCMIIAHITHLHPPVHCVGTTSAHRAAFREELPSSIHLASGRLPNSGIVCLSPFSIICVCTSCRSSNYESYSLRKMYLYWIHSEEPESTQITLPSFGKRKYEKSAEEQESFSKRESGASGDCQRLLEDSWKQQIPSLH